MRRDDVLSVREARRGWVMARLSGTGILMPVETAESHGVEPGASVDPDALLADVYPLQVADARKYTNRYLALAERSSGQLRRKLEERGYLSEVIRDCLSWAGEYGLIDDLRYAKAFAACHTLGRAGLRARLRRNGVTESAVSAVLSEAPADSVADLSALVKRKYGSIPDRETALRRAAGWLARRGFPSGLIAAVLEEAF